MSLSSCPSSDSSPIKKCIEALCTLILGWVHPKAMIATVFGSVLITFWGQLPTGEQKHSHHTFFFHNSFATIMAHIASLLLSFGRPTRIFLTSLATSFPIPHSIVLKSIACTALLILWFLWRALAEMMSDNIVRRMKRRRLADDVLERSGNRCFSKLLVAWVQCVDEMSEVYSMEEMTSLFRSITRFCKMDFLISCGIVE